MNGFIKLHERKSNAVILINTKYIVSVKDMRTDKAVKNLADWQWSVVTTTKNSYDVIETENQIVEFIKGLQNEKGN